MYMINDICSIIMQGEMRIIYEIINSWNYEISNEEIQMKIQPYVNRYIYIIVVNICEVKLPNNHFTTHKSILQQHHLSKNNQLHSNFASNYPILSINHTFLIRKQMSEHKDEKWSLLSPARKNSPSIRSASQPSAGPPRRCNRLGGR